MTVCAGGVRYGRTVSLPAQTYGRRAELLAAWWLRLHGHRVLHRNLRVAGQEVDVITRRGSLLVVVEVKARRHGGRGRPEEAVGERRRRGLRRAAEVLLLRHRWAAAVRFDVVAVDGWRVRHLPRAFD